ncbi:hypothetical protein [Ectopseudomonas composti]|uniref:hypothetical protein n=1 Tax=Ectopseudomonas composti TaxID=658457 RepID=UPI000774652F|nr:hypothetical protein [Pseudomonas composti]
MSEQVKPSVTAALAMQILADLAKRTPLRRMESLCEQQKQVGTAKLAEHLERAGDQIAGYAYNLRRHFDALHAEAEALRAENGRHKRDIDYVQENLTAAHAERVQLRQELEAARGLLAQLRGMINCTAENDADKMPVWISTKHPVIEQIDAFLATPAPEVQCKACNDTACDPSHEELVPCPECAAQPAHVDDFHGDDTALVSSAKALLALDEKGALTDGGIGGHARTIIGAFIARMAEQGDRQEAVHWRALLHPDQRPQQPHDKHVVGFTARESADAWVAEKRDFQGWDYSIEPLYTTPQPGPDVRGLVEKLVRAAEFARIDLCSWIDKYPAASHFNTNRAINYLDQALAANRKAQQGEQHD